MSNLITNIGTSYSIFARCPQLDLLLVKVPMVQLEDLD